MYKQFFAAKSENGFQGKLCIFSFHFCNTVKLFLKNRIRKSIILGSTEEQKKHVEHQSQKLGGESYANDL